jgi:hypothetical protein
MRIDIIKNENDYIYEKIVTKKDSRGNLLTEKTIISNFIADSIKIIKCDNFIEFHVELLRNIGNKIKSNIIIFSGEDFLDVKRFKRKINRNYLNFVFIGTDNDIEIIKAQLRNTCTNELIGIPYTGLVKDNNKWTYIDKNTNNENIVTQDDNIIDETFDLKDLPSTEELKDISKYLFNFNVDEIVYPVLATSVKSIFNARLKSLGIKTFVGNCTGESGSGKTTTVETIIQIISHAPIAEMAANIKEFSIIKTMSSSNIIPMIIEEYKEHKLSDHKIQLISAFIRSVYDGHQTKRGKIDQTLNEYKIISDLLIIGESSFEERAIRERIIEIIFSKLTLNKDFRLSMSKLKQKKDILHKLGNLVLLHVLNITDDEINNIYNYYKKLFKNDDIPDRIQNNILVATLCCNLFHKIFKNICNMKSMDEIFNIIKKSQTSNIIENKSVIDNTLELVSILIEKKILKEKVDFVLNEKKNTICLRITPVYHQINKYIKEYNLLDEIYDKKNNFTTQLEKTPYFVEKNKNIRADWEDKKDIKRCYVLDLFKLQSINFYIKGKVINIPEENIEDVNKYPEENIEDYEQTNFNFFDGLKNNNDDDENDNDLPLPDD